MPLVDSNGSKPGQGRGTQERPQNTVVVAEQPDQGIEPLDHGGMCIHPLMPAPQLLHAAQFPFGDERSWRRDLQQVAEAVSQVASLWEAVRSSTEYYRLPPGSHCQCPAGVHSNVAQDGKTSTPLHSPQDLNSLEDLAGAGDVNENETSFNVLIGHRVFPMAVPFRKFQAISAGCQQS
jgi:hypothetical protein